MIRRETTITLPELGLIAGTRGILGVGIGLLLANKLSQRERRPLGLALVGIGALTTIPLMIEVFGGGRLRTSVKANGHDPMRVEGTDAGDVPIT
jgi:hypothetical protein